MTKAELKKNWEKVLEILEESINRNRVDAFFRPLSPSKIREKDSSIVLICGNSAYFQSCVDRYTEDVEDATEQVFGKPYRLTVTDKETDDSELDNDQFDPRYTFDTFVAGDNNRLAYAMSMTVAERFDIKHNPLFIYGGSGLGKTHLMQAIGQYVIKENPKKKVIYVSSETFTNEYISSISGRTVDDFRNKYRSADLLLIDALHDGGLPISRDAFLKTGLTVNRLNIARFLLDVGAIANVREFFTSFAGQGCPYYVPRRDMPVQEAIQTIREAGGLPVLAHPARSHATDLIEPLSHLGLTGVEAWHSAHTVEQATTLEQLADSLGLLVTGGSDWHGDKGHHHDLASSKLPPERLARFLAADPRAHRCP